MTETFRLLGAGGRLLSVVRDGARVGIEIGDEGGAPEAFGFDVADPDQSEHLDQLTGTLLRFQTEALMRRTAAPRPAGGPRR